MSGENTTTSSRKTETSFEALLSEKQALLNVNSCESKDGFVKKLRRLLLLEKRLSKKKTSKK
jgi:hypothetical protein